MSLIDDLSEIRELLVTDLEKDHLKKLEKAIGRDFWLKKEASKHRYIYFLGNKKENRYFKKMMKHPVMDYPKNYKHDVEITKIEVENDKWKD